jgi:hypothetical protein
MITNEELAGELKFLREKFMELQAYLQGRSDSIELSKGMNGKFGWTVKVYNNNPDEALAKVQKLEASLAKLYGVE